MIDVMKSYDALRNVPLSLVGCSLSGNKGELRIMTTLQCPNGARSYSGSRNSSVDFSDHGSTNGNNRAFEAGCVGMKMSNVNTEEFGDFTTNFRGNGIESEMLYGRSPWKFSTKGTCSSSMGIRKTVSSLSLHSLVRVFSTGARPISFDDFTNDSEVVEERDERRSTKKNGRSARRRATPAVLTMTKEAANRIRELTTGKDDVLGIRITVRKRGCNGYSYNMNYATTAEQSRRNDEVVEMDGVKVFVDPAAVFFIVGTEMNYEETELAAEFTFTNPNSKGECGCGESFNI